MLGEKGEGRCRSQTRVVIPTGEGLASLSHVLPGDTWQLISVLLKPARHEIALRVLLDLLVWLVRLFLLVWLARLTVMLDSPNSLKQPRNRYPGCLMFGTS